MSMRYVTYNRVSTDEQTSGTSLDWQRDQQRAWGDRAGWAHVEDIFDGGESGAKLDRAGVQRTIELLKDGGVDLVSFFKVDRVARAQRVFEDLWTMIFALGAKVFVLQKAKVYETLDELMGDTVWDRAMAEQERYSIQSRTNDGLIVAMNAGSFVFRPVYGYYLAKERVGGVNINVPKIDPERAKVVEEVIDRTIAGESYEGIAARMNAKGVRTSLRREWTSASVQNILKHGPMYAGLPFTFARTVRGKRIEGTYSYPPIVDKQKAVRLGQALRAKPRKHGEKVSPLRGLVRCSHCGSTAIAVCVGRHDGIVGFQFYCNTHRRAVRTNRQKRQEKFPVCPHTVSAAIVARKLQAWVEDGKYAMAKVLALGMVETVREARDTSLAAVQTAEQDLERLERRLLSVPTDAEEVFRLFNTQIASQRERIVQAQRMARDLVKRAADAEAWLARLPGNNGEALVEAITANDRGAMQRAALDMGLRIKIDFKEPSRTKRRNSVKVVLVFDPADAGSPEVS